MEGPGQYRVEPPVIPDEDLSGSIGPRLLDLLSIQVERNLEYIADSRRKAGIADDSVIVVQDGQYFGHFVGGCAYAAAVLARFGEPGKTMAGVSRETLERTAVALVQAVARDHKLGGGAKDWPKFSSPRFIHLMGMGAWLVRDRLDAQTQLLVSRILAYEADRFLGAPAPTQLYDDTQAESNAWTGAGIATASCMLKRHPHRERWAEKAKEYMLSAYATARDVASDDVVDGRPLKQWLTGPNAFPDYAVENHGFVHPDYLAAVSEMVRSAIAYRLAGEPAPEAVTFNAGQVFDLLAFLLLPDGTHLYVQGTDYTPRRIASFFQACDVVPLKPGAKRTACFRRSLEAIERMATDRPDLPMSGWIGMSCDLGATWGLTQNYLVCRLFGAGGTALPDGKLESALTGVHHSELGRFIVHRTAKTVSSFAWHPVGKLPKVMGLTMPLTRDVLCYPMPWSPIGEVREAGRNGEPDKPPALVVRSHHVTPHENGFAAMVELEWCSGKVRQNCAFISLPDGASVYLEERTAERDVVLAAVRSGNVVIFDDLKWPCQSKPRAFVGAHGSLAPTPSRLQTGAWINVDDRMGYVVLGAEQFRLFRCKGKPAIWRGGGTMYDTCRLEFIPPVAGSEVGRAPARIRAGQRVGAFAMVSCPNHTRQETALLAERIGKAGWELNTDGVLALRVGEYTVYANASSSAHRVADCGRCAQLPARSCGWLSLREGK